MQITFPVLKRPMLYTAASIPSSINNFGAKKKKKMVTVIMNTPPDDPDCGPALVLPRYTVTNDIKRMGKKAFEIVFMIVRPRP